MNRVTEYPVQNLLAERYSPRSFLDRPVEERDMRIILEAGRLAPSCFNEQPWACVYAVRQDTEEFERLLSCLTPKNRSWAAASGALMVTAAHRYFSASGKENRFAFHDTGSFMVSMLVQGTSMGIYGHPMAGFSQDKARELLAIPGDYDPVAALAWGYPGPPEACPEEFQEKEAVRTPRKDVSSFAFRNRWQ